MSKRRNPFYLTAFKHSYKPKIRGDDLSDIVAVAKKALEKKKKSELIQKEMNKQKDCNAMVKGCLEENSCLDNGRVNLNRSMDAQLEQNHEGGQVDSLFGS